MIMKPSRDCIMLKRKLRHSVNKTILGHRKYLFQQRFHTSSHASNEEWNAFLESLSNNSMRSIKRHKSGKIQLHIKWTDIYDNGEHWLLERYGLIIVPTQMELFFNPSKMQISLNFCMHGVTNI